MDLLSKLENVDIQIIDRFPPDDMEYCRHEEQQYQEVYGIYSEVAFICKDANSKLETYPGDLYIQSVDDNAEKVYKWNKRFISRICGYFRHKYAVSIDDPNWTARDEESRRNDRDRDDIVPLQYILDSVYEQMGGMSFEEKAFNELKADAKDAVVSYSGKSKYAIKGTRLVIDDFYHSYKCHIFKRYQARVEAKHKAFYKVLSHFEYGSYEISHKYDFLCGWELDERDGVYDKHEIYSSIVKSLKIFKNGKVEVEFKDYMTIVKFMDIYFPSVPQQAAA